MGIIYQLINKIDGTTYIGATTLSINKIWKHHIDQAMRMSPLLIHKEMRKHKNHNFMLKEVCDCNESELLSKKEHYIKELRAYDVDTEIEEEIIIEKPKEKKPFGFQDPKNRGSGKDLRLRIMSVNVDTGEEREWESITSAALELTGDSKKTGNIVRAMNKGYKAYGHLWKRMDKSTQYIKCYGVHKITWIRTQVFNSIKEASRACGGKYSESGIRKSIDNPRRNSYKGYYWFKL